MAKRSRTKGRRGETEAKLLMQDRDWDVADLTSGISAEDFWATDTNGVTWSVEVKNRKLINIREFKAQAIRNAGKKPWMVMAKIEGCGEWLVVRKGCKSQVWPALKVTRK
jgi:hypothetical protein